MKYELKDSTRCNYKYMWRKFIRDGIGQMEIGKVKFSDVKKFYILLIREGGFKPNSVENIQTILHPVFESAVRDGYIRINPTKGVLSEIKKSHDWEKPKRHALTEKQQHGLLNSQADLEFTIIGCLSLPYCSELAAGSVKCWGSDGRTATLRMVLSTSITIWSIARWKTGRWRTISLLQRPRVGRESYLCSRM